jgi:hypothetical protein
MPLTTYVSGEVLTAASLNDNLAYAVTVPAAVPGGLTLVTSQVIGSAVASVTVTGAFSATYDNYLITVNSNTVSSGGVPINMRFGAVTSGYKWSYSGTSYNSVAFLNGSASDTYLSNVAVYIAAGYTASIEVLSPFLTQLTQVKSSTIYSTSAASYLGIESSATSHTSFLLAPSSGTMTGGTIRVYGYANS